MMGYSQGFINGAFELLEAELKLRALPTSAGAFRFAEASEFMFMGRQAGGELFAFKHRDTRNYVFVIRGGGLLVPADGRPFMRGTFDAINPVALRAALGLSRIG